MNLDKAFYCMLTEYIKSNMSLLEIWLFRAKLAQLTNICYRNWFFFFCLVIYCAERICYSRDSKDPRTFRHSRHRIWPASWLWAAVTGRDTNTDYPQTHTRLIPGMKLISLETLQGFKGKHSAGKTHPTGMLEFHSHWKSALRELSFLVPECQQSESAQEQNNYFPALLC